MDKIMEIRCMQDRVPGMNLLGERVHKAVKRTESDFVRPGYRMKVGRGSHTSMLRRG